MRTPIRYAVGSAIALVTSLTGRAIAQAAPPAPPVGPAQAALAAGKPDSAIALLEPYFRENPNATLGWLLLGNAYKQTGRLDRALSAFEKAIAFRPTWAAGTYNVATVLAAKGLADSALTLLERVKASG